jgi:hypothetical protein
MPIRYRDQQTRLGQVSSTLAGASAALSGTFVGAAARTGAITAQLSGVTAALSGIYSSAPNRTGVIGATLAGATSSITGSLSITPAAAEQDWIARSTGAGVVWAHDFRNPNELTNFLWLNTDPRYSGVMPRRTADGPTGYCLEYVALGALTTATFGTSATTLTIDDATHWPTGDFYFYLTDTAGAGGNNMFYCPAGGRSGATLSGLTYVSSVAGFTPCAAVRKSWPAGSVAGHHVEQTWNRPFPAFASPGNGKPADDVNNAGVTLRTWSPLATTSSNAIYGYGWYGRAEYQATYSTWQPTNGTGGANIGSPRVAPWDGDEFYIQFRVKIDRRFWDNHLPLDASTTNVDTTWAHKLLFIQSQSTVPQQLVPFLSNNNKYNIPTTRTAPFQWYTTQAGRQLTTNLDGTGSYQPGSQWQATATYAASNLAAGSAWEWFDDEWVTVLIRVKPGLHWDRTGNPSATGVRNTVLEVKVARDGEAYTTVFSQSDQAISYGSTNDSQGEFFNALPGYCAFIPTMYLNVDLGATPPKKSYYHRFTQIIFSKQSIPAPAATAPAWFLSQTSGTWGTVATAGTIAAVMPSPAPVATSSENGVQIVGIPGDEGILNSWTGASVDEARGEYLATANGGHADYPGNEVYAISLRTATPAWRRLTDPTPDSQMVVPFNDTTAPTADYWKYADGRPRSMHNTFQEFANGKVWIPYMNSVTGGSPSFNKVIAFNRNFPALLTADGTRATGGSGSSLAWTSSNTGPWETSYTGGSGVSGGCDFGRAVFNPRDGYVYAFAGKSANSCAYWRVDTATGAASALQSAGTIFPARGAGIGNFSSWVVCIPDVGPAGVIVLGCSFTKQICVYDCSKFGQVGAWSVVTNVTGTGWFDPDNFGSADGVYLSQFRQIAVGNPTYLNGRIYKLQTPTSVNVATFVSSAWAWTNFLPSGATVSTDVASSNGAGSWGRWRLIQNMGNGQSAIVFAGKVNGPVYVYKVLTTGLP